jgi:phenylalanyl-tRNA synthetase beta chain
VKASIKWIRELLPKLKATPEQIAKRLSNAGIEVESLVTEASGLEQVIVGEVKSLRPHPDADALRIAEVFDGDRTLTVVCGAPNVAEGQKVAFAQLDARLPNGMHIERRKIRGVESEGMICSEAELGLSDDSSGIIVLKPRARAGRPLQKELELDDHLMEIAATPNRPDVLSHHGLARELAAIFGLPQPRVSVRLREAKESATQRAKVEIKDPKRCSKYVGRVVVGVRVGPSPEEVVRRLKAVGLRSISNVVDATNLVLLELGHPLHAFDLDKLHGGRIVVRTAEPGEKLVTLDEVERTLDADDCVIADQQRAVALGGVMGGLETEVTGETTNLLLEAAVFDPRSVRRTSKRLALHTEASHRFERGADPEMVEAAIDRCAQLIVELAGGQVLKGRLVAEKAQLKRAVVPIRPSRAARVLGRSVDKAEVKSALLLLGLRQVKKPEKLPKNPQKQAKAFKKPDMSDAAWFEVPSWRVDLSREEDLIEEVARLGGFGAIPTLMPPAPSTPWREAPAADAERRVKALLASEGFLETIALAFNSRKDVAAFSLDAQVAVLVANPLGEESALMRMSLLPSLLRAARHNQDMLPSATDLRLFEVGKTFAWSTPPAKLPIETQHVSMVVRGHRVPPTWAARDAKGAVPVVDAFDLKATAERVLEAFRVFGASFVPDESPHLHPRSATRIELLSRTLGHLGELHPDVMASFGLEGPPVFVLDLLLDAIAEVGGGVAAFKPLPKHPPARRDLSFFIGRDIPSARVLEVVKKASTATLEATDIFDVYEGQGLPEGKRSLAVSMIFRAPDRTLTDDEVERAQAAIIERLSAELGAEIRSARA